MKELQSGERWVIPLISVCAISLLPALCEAQSIKIGLNYPETGPYSVQGLDQLRAAELAVEEINTGGGILGKRVEIVKRDSQSRPDLTRENVSELIDQEKVKMVFGGSSSGVAIAAGEVCQARGVLFFGTLTYSTATTGTDAHRHTFRECYNAWMGAKAIASYLNSHFPAKSNKYLYITADYTWGHTTEASMRHFTNTGDAEVHRGIKTPFPDATESDFRKVIAFARMVDPDVLVLVLFGKDMSAAIRLATNAGLKAKTQIVVPNLTLGMAEGGGPKVMEGVIGALPWCWRVPYKYNYSRGKEFVEKFADRYQRYPSTSGASAYSILYQYKEAVERAGTFDTPTVIKTLEGYEYSFLKDKQIWRDFDHQSVQTVFAVKCKPEVEVLKDRFKLDYFEILSAMPGQEAARTRTEWNAVRASSGKPARLESLLGE